ncbi:MAG: hypothetical protein Q4F96_02700 [Bacillota bacterium]|jgi:phosphoribosylcarboxyaminoimidazole (NCAIR) mutase|nr:hypothetical protein [Bacillota bacterium]
MKKVGLVMGSDSDLPVMQKANYRSALQRRPFQRLFPGAEGL